MLFIKLNLINTGDRQKISEQPHWEQYGDTFGSYRNQRLMMSLSYLCLSLEPNSPHFFLSTSCCCASYSMFRYPGYLVWD